MEEHDTTSSRAGSRKGVQEAGKVPAYGSKDAYHPAVQPVNVVRRASLVPQQPSMAGGDRCRGPHEVAAIGPDQDVHPVVDDQPLDVEGRRDRGAGIVMDHKGHRKPCLAARQVDPSGAIGMLGPCLEACQGLTSLKGIPSGRGDAGAESDGFHHLSSLQRAGAQNGVGHIGAPERSAPRPWQLGLSEIDGSLLAVVVRCAGLKLRLHHLPCLPRLIDGPLFFDGADVARVLVEYNRLEHPAHDLAAPSLG